MVKNEIRLTLPKPHKKEIGVALLRKILKQAGFTSVVYLEGGMLLWKKVFGN